MQVRDKSDRAIFILWSSGQSRPMKNRGCFLLLPLLALAGNANSVLAQRSALQVQVYDYAGLSPAAFHEFAARTQENPCILRHFG
jgi:hypothetical protein